MTSIPEVPEDTRFSVHDEPFGRNVCFKSNQGLTLRLWDDKYQLLSGNGIVLYNAKTEGCPEKVTTWISTEDGSEVNLDIVHLHPNNPPAGEKRCCKNSEGGYRIFNNGNH